MPGMWAWGQWQLLNILRLERMFLKWEVSYEQLPTLLQLLPHVDEHPWRRRQNDSRFLVHILGSEPQLLLLLLLLLIIKTTHLMFIANLQGRNYCDLQFSKEETWNLTKVIVLGKDRGRTQARLQVFSLLLNKWFNELMTGDIMIHTSWTFTSSWLDCWCFSILVLSSKHLHDALSKFKVS